MGLMRAGRSMVGLGLLAALTLSAAAAGGARGRIRAVMAAQVRAWNRGDIAGFMRGYWRSPRTEFVGPQGIEHGWQALLHRYRREYPTPAAMGRLQFKILSITLLGRGAALVTGEYTLARKGAGRGARRRGVFTLVWRKFAGGWKIINDHTSPYAASRRR